MYYFFAAYLVIWVLLFGYSMLLGKRQGRIQEELDVLQAALQNGKIVHKKG